MERTGRVQTVRGLIDPAELGITLLHEHLLLDHRFRHVPPEEVSRGVFAQAPLTPRIRADVSIDSFGNLDNLTLLDERVAVEEAMEFRLAGGGTIADCTTLGLGRDPLALRRISLATGLHVSMGAGYYV